MIGVIVGLLAAQAQTGREGVVLPGASALEAGGIHVEGIAAGAVAFPAWGSSFLGGQFSAGLTDRIALFGSIGQFGASSFGTDPWHLLTLRANLIESEVINLGLMVTHDARWQSDFEGHVGAGFALLAGSGPSKLDVSVPSVFGFRRAIQGGVPGNAEVGQRSWMGVWLGSGAEVGVTMGAGKTHRFRIGLPALFGYQLRAKVVTFDVGITPLIIANAAWLKLGVRI